MAKEIAAGLREAGGGPAGCGRSACTSLTRGRAQVSLNVHDPYSVPLADLVARVRERAPVAEAELVASRRGPRSTASRTTCRCAASTPSGT